jgi:hypothetical protein
MEEEEVEEAEGDDDPVTVEMSAWVGAIEADEIGEEEGVEGVEDEVSEVRKKDVLLLSL